MTSTRFDLFVIGGGSGGVRAARMAARRGARVGLAEGSAMGGTCVNLGCIPKKLYSYAAHYAESFEESHGFGWIGEAPKFDWEILKTNRAREISRLNSVYERLLIDSGVELVSGWAKLLDAHTIEVNGRTYAAQNILIATGGKATLPNVLGHHLAVTSDNMFDLTPFPRRLLVVGGGYIACEFASIFNGLGSKVTQVHRGEMLLTGFDDDIRRFIDAEMHKTGVTLHMKSEVESIQQVNGGLLVVEKHWGTTFTVDAVLNATGRVPNIDRLGLDAAGVKVTAKGAIQVDNNYQTSVPSIYALGDVVARLQLTPVATGEAMALVDHLFGPPAGMRPRHMSYRFIPTAVFTHPNIGTVGFSEADARAEFGQITVYSSVFKSLKHTLSGSTERTLMKLLVDNATDRVVGLHMVGPDAGEIVQGFAVAMKAGATKAIFDSTVGIHPTVAEEFVTMRESRR